MKSILFLSAPQTFSIKSRNEKNGTSEILQVRENEAVVFDCLYVDYYPRVDSILYYIGNQTTKLQSVSFKLQLKKFKNARNQKHLQLISFRYK